MVSEKHHPKIKVYALAELETVATRSTGELQCTPVAKPTIMSAVY